MEPNSSPQPYASPAPAPASHTPQQPATNIKPNNTNYAAAVFFTLLIIGFTFHLPSLLYVPLLFFCAVAGVLFFRDVMSDRKLPPPSVGQSGAYAAPADAPKKKRSTLKKILLIILVVAGLFVLASIGFIIFIIIALSSSGV